MFDWQTDEDESVWKEDAAPPKETAVSPKRHWWGYLLAAGLLLLGSTFVYRQLKQQAETAVVAVEEDILSTHNLLISATKAGDADLVRVLLSGRDLSWVDAHEQLAAQSLTYNRTPLAMAWEPENQTIVETDINPALDTAELIFDQEYVTALPDGETETITLRQTAVYRLGRTRWLLSPPDDEFWGAWETIENDQLILIYPNRDQEIATRLFPDLLTILEISCRTLADIECDTDQQISVRLDKKLQSMADMGDPAALFSQGLRLELPTPSLVGMPVDDASYEALLRGYATALVTAVIADATEWDCCEHAAIFQALTDFQLDQVGLRAWPVTLDDHIDLWNGEELTTLEGLFLFWNQEGFVDLDAEDERFLYTAVDFLMRQFSSRSPAFMQAHMNVRGNSFNRWVSETIAININEPFAGTGATIYNLDNEWRLMVQLLQTAQTSDERPIAIPHQDVQLLCTDDGNEPLLTTLWRYNLETNEWIAEANTASFMLMYPLADDSSIILLQIGFEQEDQRARLELWNQESIQLLSRDDRYMISLGQMHPSGDYLYSYIQPASNFPPVSEHLLQNLTDCDEVGCAEQDLPGMPVWSPSGDHAIYMEAPFLSIAPTLPDGRVWLIDELPVGEMFPLFRGNGDGNPDSMVNVAFGYSPFWLDDSTYGFIQGIDQLNQSLQIASIEDDVPQQLIEMADILAALPEDVNPRRLTMDYVIPDPYRESHFFLIMSDIDFHGYIFRVDRNTGEVEFRVDVGLMIRHMTGFSPNGRYLVTTRNFIDAGIDGSTDFISFHDVDGNNTQNFLYDSPDFFSAFVFDWSYDGNWMITILDEGVLQLMAPEYNYRQLIEHDFGVCQSVAWINREPTNNN